MGLTNFTPDDTDDLGLERRVREKIRSHGFKVKKTTEKGESGNDWELDAVAYDDDGSPIAYFEVKDIGEETQNSTYRHHMERAVTQIADFRHEDVPGAIIVPDKRDFGNKDWGALFESLGCRFLDEDELDDFLSILD